jgi:hypothetical protein
MPPTGGVESCFMNCVSSSADIGKTFSYNIQKSLVLLIKFKVKQIKTL